MVIAIYAFIGIISQNILTDNDMKIIDCDT